MYCEHCGSITPTGIYFCPYCGYSLENAADTVPVEIAPVKPPSKETTTGILLWGIASIASAVTGVAAVLGLIFGIITLRKVNRLKNAGYTIEGRVRVGRVLGKIGLFLGAAVTYLFALWFYVYLRHKVLT